MSSISTTMTAAVERGMRFASVEFALAVIGQLSSEGVLICSKEEAIKLFDFDSVAVVSSRSKASKKRESGKSVKKVSAKITVKPTVILPFCDKIQADWCHGVKLNHGLHTQCTNGPSGTDTYCKTCRKHADNSATGKPPYGDINDRAKFDVDYRDPKGKLTMPYANVIEILGISLEAANAAATTLGWTIPAEQLVKRVSKRGRPAKSAAVSDSDSDTEDTSKKKRGRPSKTKVVESPTQEDQIAQLVAEAFAETEDTKTEVAKTEETKTEETKTEVSKPVVKKVKKLKVKKSTLTAEQKEQAKIAKKEAADKLKAEKKEAADKLKDEKKALALKVKEEKAVAKALEKEQKEAEATKVKAEKKVQALQARKEKAAAKKAEREAAKLATKQAKAETSDESAPEDTIVVEELEEEVILDEEEIAELEVDSSDDEEGEVELSETKTVGGIEYFVSELDGQTVLFSKSGEPVGVYDADTDTVQECEFDEE